MTSQLLNTLFLAGAFLTLFASAEIAYHRFGFKAEVTRKYVHVMTGLLTMLFPPLIQNHWLVLALCGSFLVILIASMKFNLLHSINAVDRRTSGSLLYPIIVYVCYVIAENYGQTHWYYLPILILAICDPAAAFVGKRWPRGKYTSFGHQKTLSGSGTFLLTAVSLTASLLILAGSDSGFKWVWISCLIGGVATTAEAVTHGGFDNLSIPFSVLFILMLLS